MKKRAAPKSSPKSQINDTSTEAQQSRILKALQHAGQSGLTTVQIRDELNCMHPAGRVQELREQHYRIVTNWASTEHSFGSRHRTARYVLLSSRRDAA